MRCRLLMKHSLTNEWKKLLFLLLFVSCFLVSVLVALHSPHSSLAKSLAVRNQKPSIQLPLDFPLPPLTAPQIAAVRRCDLATLVKQRYPDVVERDRLLTTYQPTSDCDWATLALAYAIRTKSNQPFPDAAKATFSQMIAQNVGFAFANPIFYNYFGAFPVVKAPTFAQQPITEVQIKYGWIGLGEGVRHAIAISQADITPKVSVASKLGFGTPQPKIFTIDKATVQSLAGALGDLLPVKSRFQITPCTDNYPVWTVSLTFRNGKTLTLETDSNFLIVGGPWQTAINQQPYVQFSPAFAQALINVFKALELPFGRTAGMACGGGASIFDQAFAVEQN